jgi:hypothetical protein
VIVASSWRAAAVIKHAVVPLAASGPASAAPAARPVILTLAAVVNT